MFVQGRSDQCVPISYNCIANMTCRLKSEIMLTWSQLHIYFKENNVKETTAEIGFFKAPLPWILNLNDKPWHSSHYALAQNGLINN